MAFCHGARGSARDHPALIVCRVRAVKTWPSIAAIFVPGFLASFGVGIVAIRLIQRMRTQ